MSLRLVLGSALVLATLAGCSDRPLPVAAAGPPRPARQIAATSVVDGFTITLIPPVPGGGFLLPRRIDDDGTVYGQFENAELPDLNHWRWTAAGGTEPVDHIPPDLAGVGAFEGQYFYDDGTVRHEVGRRCGHAGPADPALESPDFCDYEFVVGTYATSSCFPDSPEPGIHSAGFAVNALCHVLAARRAYGTSMEDLALYLWRAESGWQHVLDDPQPEPLFRFFGMRLLNNTDQVVVLARTSDQTDPSVVTTFWSAELGARAVPAPPNTGLNVSVNVTALNDRGQMTGFVEGLSASGESILASLVWTPPAVDRSDFPTVDLTPKKKSPATTFRLSGNRAYKLFYQIGATDGGAPWQVRVEWGDGTETLSTHTQTGKLEHESHRYSAPGAYVIRVTVVDALDRGTSDSYTVEVVR